MGIDDRQRIFNFKKATLFGPIFICSCCKRKLFQHSVVKITQALREKINKKVDSLYSTCIIREEIVNVNINGNNEKTGAYICSTCKSTLLAGKIPAMAEVNGLGLVNIKENCHLTEFENNLIAQNLNFQYIYCLKKSRMAANKNQMISVPVHPETVRQLPRLPKSQLTSKEKKTYKNCHK